MDIVPTEGAILGFTSRWARVAMDAPARYALPSGTSIRLVAAPVFLLMKLEAFASRGEGDFAASHDLEDVVAVVDGRASLLAEVAASPATVRAAVRDEIARLLAERAFTDALPGHLPGDSGSQARLGRVRATLDQLAQPQAT